MNVAWSAVDNDVIESDFTFVEGNKQKCHSTFNAGIFHCFILEPSIL